MEKPAAREFVARFHEVSDALRTELIFAGEAALIRRALEHGSALERGVLLIVLGHGENIVAKVGGESEQAAAHAADERAKRFLRGLIGDGEAVGKETLRPAPDAIGEDVYVLNVGSGEVKPFNGVA